MRKQKKKNRFKTRIPHQSIETRVIEMEPEDLAKYVRQAEQQITSIVKELEISAGASIFLLANYTQALITDNPQVTLESASSITENVVALWQTGSYRPGPDYPFTLEETLQDLQGGGIKEQTDYSKFFQPFAPEKTVTPSGLGQVAGGIVQHPKTHLWQIWMLLDGPCTFLGAYRDPATAQKNLEKVIDMTRKGGTIVDVRSLHLQLRAQGDGEPQQLTFDMMGFLLDHLDLYKIEI